MKPLLSTKLSALAAVLLSAACGGQAENHQPDNAAASVPTQTASAASNASETSAEAVSDGHNAENSLDWPGIYQGALPCADCSKNLVTLQLNDDKTYILTTDSQGGKEPLKTVEKGSFTWEGDGSIVKLDEHAAQARFFVAEGYVQMLAAGQSGFKENSRYNLQKQE